jgi:hypothetical protein
MSTIYTPSNTNHASITIPSDGDAATAASVDTPLEAIADNAAYAIARLTGASRVMIGPSANTLVAMTTTGWGSSVTYVTAVGAVGPIAGPFQVFWTGALLAGDIVAVQTALTLKMLNDTMTPMYARLEFSENYNGSSGTTSPDTASEQELATTATQPTVFPGVSLISAHLVLTPGRLGIFVNGRVASASGTATDWQATGGSMIYTVYRPN